MSKKSEAAAAAQAAAAAAELETPDHLLDRAAKTARLAAREAAQAEADKE